MSDSMTWTPQLTDDGSFTFFSEEFREAFHSHQGAREEAFVKFSQATDLPEKAQQPKIRLLDVCYGLGYNTAAALETIWRVNPDCHLEIYALELDKTVPKAAIAPPFLAGWSPAVQAVLTALALNHQHIAPGLDAKLLIGDARQMIQTLHQTGLRAGFQAEAIFFDPFSPRRCPQLWTVEFFKTVARCLAPTGKLATYSRSAAVRSAMLSAGLQVGTIPLKVARVSPHEWSHGTIASFASHKLLPLSAMEQEHLQTRAAIPYRDPDLSDPAAVILERHRQEQQHCLLEPTSSWRRRWGIQ